MSHEVNTNLIEQGYEILDEIHKYDYPRLLKALEEEDLDTVHAFIKKHADYETYRNIIN